MSCENNRIESDKKIVEIKQEVRGIECENRSSFASLSTENLSSKKISLKCSTG